MRKKTVTQENAVETKNETVQTTTQENQQQYLTTSILMQIQQELKVPKNNFNSFGKYKYRSAEDILESLKPLLQKYHSTLLLQDEVKEVCGVPYVVCTAQLITPLGVFQTTSNAGIDVNKKGMDISQTFGSSISYARKYAIGGLLLIDDTKDSDATNEHTDKSNDVKTDKSKTESSKALPSVTDDVFSKLIERYTNGEKDIFNKASNHYTFSIAQIGIISKMINNSKEKENNN